MRRHLLCLTLTLGLLPLPLFAGEQPLDGATFEATVTGQTLDFAAGGQSYGSEQYLPGRRVVWAFEGGPCRDGTWHEPAPGLICFSYEHDPEPQCWNFFDDGGRLRARLPGANILDDLQEVHRSRAPLSCPGPDLGA